MAGYYACGAFISFLDDNFSKYQGIFTKLVMCIYIVDICFGVLMVEFWPFLTELSAHNTSLFYFNDNNFSKSLWISTKFDMCIDIVEMAYWRILSIRGTVCRVSALWLGGCRSPADSYQMVLAALSLGVQHYKSRARNQNRSAPCQYNVT